MTEAQWLTTDRFRDLVTFAADPPERRGFGAVFANWFGRKDADPVVPDSDRKFRLLAVGCCRHVWTLDGGDPLTDHPFYRDAGWLERLERLADEDPNREDALAVRDVGGGYFGVPHHHDMLSMEDVPIRFFGLSDRPRRLWKMARHLVVHPFFERVLPVQSAAGAAVVRCVFGNPFRRHRFDRRWQTSAVLALARGMYESRDFSPMPILADALQEAGCEHPDVLAHCRGGGPHARGCWVVDAALGLE